MSFLSAMFYDKLMKSTEEACLIGWRKELLKDIDGKVLEIGAGTGASLDLYPKNPALELFLSEPDENMRQQLEQKIRQKQLSNVTVLACPGEEIDSEDNFFDVVFVSLVCCSVADVDASLKEIKRVLKPNGRFVFLEHVAANDGTGRRIWQNRLNGFWRKIAGNCHLNRETEQHIKDAGFAIEEIKYESMDTAFPLVNSTIRGVARAL